MNIRAMDLLVGKHTVKLSEFGSGLYIDGPGNVRLCIDTWHMDNEEGDGRPLVIIHSPEFDDPLAYIRFGEEEMVIETDPVPFVWKPAIELSSAGELRVTIKSK